MGVREQIVQLRSDALDEVRYAVGERNRILQEKAQIEGTLRASIAAALEVGLDSEDARHRSRGESRHDHVVGTPRAATDGGRGRPRG